MSEIYSVFARMTKVFFIIKPNGRISIVFMALGAGFCILLVGFAETGDQYVLQRSTPRRLGRWRDEKKLQTSS
jgi:hypothetical protein